MRKKAHFSLLIDHALLLALAAAVLAFTSFGDVTQGLLRYDRTAIANGEWWRGLTGHLMHLNGTHLALNLIGLALCALLVGAGLRGIKGIAVLCGAAAACSLGLWLFNPEVQWYTGLSGVLHGLLLGGALGLPSHQRRWRGILGLLIIAKLLGEQLIGPSLSTQNLIGYAVVVDAHLYGAVGGVFGWLVYRQCRNRHTRPRHR